MMHLKGHSWILRLIEGINQILQSLQAMISTIENIYYFFTNNKLLQIIIFFIFKNKSISLTLSEIYSLQAKMY